MCQVLVSGFKPRQYREDTPLLLSCSTQNTLTTCSLRAVSGEPMQSWAAPPVAPVGMRRAMARRSPCSAVVSSLHGLGAWPLMFAVPQAPR